MSKLADVLTFPFKLILVAFFLIMYIAIYMIFGDDEDLDGWGTREFYGGKQ